MERRRAWSRVLWPGLFLLGIVLPGAAQTGGRETVIRGTVRDSLTGRPLEHVNVFLASTTIGTGTRADGSFLLANIPAGSYDLVFSRVGYALEHLHIDADSGLTLRYAIRLRPRLIAVEEVEIAADQREWKERLAGFLRIFLGETGNAEKCRLTNPEALNLRVDRDRDELLATAESTLIVDNRGLGYRLHLELEQFRWSLEEGAGVFLAYALFEPLAARTAVQTRAWEDARRHTYRTSLRHFLVALISGRLEEEGFRLFSGRLEDLQQRLGRSVTPAQMQLMPVPGTPFTRWIFEGWLRVEQEIPGSVATSYIRLVQPAAIDRAGALRDPLAIGLLGYWQHYRVADLLPLEYAPARGRP